GFGGAVMGVEREAVRCDRVRANAAGNAVDVRVVPGEAPGALAGLPDPDAVFVGGGGAAVIEAVAARQPARIVVALAAVERAGPAHAALHAAGYAVDGALLQAARLAPLPGDVHRLAATNPVFLLWGTAGPTAGGGGGARGARPERREGPGGPRRCPGAEGRPPEARQAPQADRPRGRHTSRSAPMIGLIAVTLAGRASAARLAEAWPAETRA